jgi:predicted PurR-regulated permease PerM
VQVIENYLLDPVIDRKTVYLPPALTIFGQLVLGVFVGLIGVAFAAPLVAISMVLVRELYVKRAADAQ